MTLTTQVFRNQHVLRRVAVRLKEQDIDYTLGNRDGATTLSVAPEHAIDLAYALEYAQNAEDALAEEPPAEQQNLVGFRVCAKRCDECLFTPQRIVSSERMKEVIQSTLAKGSYFVCHKATLRGMRHEADEQEAAVACRGWVETFPMSSPSERIARMWDMVIEVDEQGNVVRAGAGAKPKKERGEP